jgi:hypothetical protein
MVVHVAKYRLEGHSRFIPGIRAITSTKGWVTFEHWPMFMRILSHELGLQPMLAACHIQLGHLGARDDDIGLQRRQTGDTKTDPTMTTL